MLRRTEQLIISSKCCLGREREAIGLLVSSQALLCSCQRASPVLCWVCFLNNNTLYFIWSQHHCDNQWELYKNCNWFLMKKLKKSQYIFKFSQWVITDNGAYVTLNTTLGTWCCYLEGSCLCLKESPEMSLSCLVSTDIGRNQTKQNNILSRKVGNSTIFISVVAFVSRTSFKWLAEFNSWLSLLSRQCFPHIDFTWRGIETAAQVYLATRSSISLCFFLSSFRGSDAIHDQLTSGQSAVALRCPSAVNPACFAERRSLLLHSSCKCVDSDATSPCVKATPCNINVGS